ncbi:hypothetical protein LB534_20310 [Mesorhizobium sp. CA18]|uniref:hypothetical protein n=1 Tax=unclassified Mesorhizobium TaxID=325217 RepID=UPI001CC9809E|nr:MULTISPECIES: hypothetical protein [unclassified Mesorhizobium]MBZ9735762.1 hypothetical protein [Mesorhizobium sp. CA9]MBZ9827637.1 hypothetical protein [Mesorhizobium sp. CA18]MBZ9833339.1 hypothetical protein [Mesorhizobium sp. CA2]MBZ9839650.1 hypothetical protein [Mesorhizobium sp. CA3]MBZ9879853.1 hypothetical protein [Mesorhizobium sp. Ca11]
MSSSRLWASVDDIAPGEYTVVATRPSGDQLVVAADVGPLGGEALIALPATRPGSRRRPASRGLDDSTAGSEAGFGLESTASWSQGLTARSMRSLEAHRRQPEGPDSIFGDFSSIAFSRRCLKLVGWAFRAGYWHGYDHFGDPQIVGDGDVLKIALTAEFPVAIGLLNEGGFGSIVVVPPLAGGVDITFVAAGVDLAGGADRINNPSSIRVPVAIPMPRDPALADLLAGLSAPALPDALSLLPESGAANISAAIRAFRQKYDNSTSAVLGALFLDRFAPTKLSIKWLRNLYRLLPDIGDTALLLATAHAAQEQPSEKVDTLIRELLHRAVSSHCFLFARSRSQLSQMLHRYGFSSRAPKRKKEEIQRRYIGQFLDFGADAGGLEAFWGISPYFPGYKFPTDAWNPYRIQIVMINGKFTVVQQPGAPALGQPTPPILTDDSLRAFERLERRLGLREQITHSYEHSYTYRNHSGTEHEYARVTILFEPQRDSDQLIFRSEITGGAVPRAFIPAVERGLKSAIQAGPIRGLPVVGLKATLIDGAYHDVDSSDQAFEQAARNCYFEALGYMGARLTQPLMEIEVLAPDVHLSKILKIKLSLKSDVREQIKRVNVIMATVPLSDVQEYLLQISTILRDQTNYSVRFLRYGGEIPIKPRDDRSDSISA